MPKTNKKGPGGTCPISGRDSTNPVANVQEDFRGTSQPADLISWYDDPVALQNTRQPTNSLLAPVQNVMRKAYNVVNTAKQYWNGSESSQPPQTQIGPSGLSTTVSTPVAIYDSNGRFMGYSLNNMSVGNGPYHGPEPVSFDESQALQSNAHYHATNLNTAQGYVPPISYSSHYPYSRNTNHGGRNSGNSGFHGSYDSSYIDPAVLNPVPVITPEEQKLIDEMEKMKKDQEKAVREREEKIRKRREEKLLKEQLVKEEMDRYEKQQEELETERFRDSQMRLERETERLKKESENKARLKEKFYQEEMLSLRRAGEREREDILEKRQREQADFERLVAEKDKLFDVKTIEFQNEEEMRKEEIRRAQEEHEERVRQIFVELERRKEEFHRQHEERKNQMKKQWEQIQLLLKYKVWNEVIERCWTNRLNVLRNSNRKVADMFRRFYHEANFIQKRLDQSGDVTREIQRVVPVLNALLETLKLETELMHEEAKNLEIQWQNTQKNFVLDILTAVNAVQQACELLESSLKSYQNLIKDGSTLVLHGQQLEETKLFFDSLSKCSGEIPTLAELKRNFREDMQNEASPNNSQEVVPAQSVIIEEIE